MVTSKHWSYPKDEDLVLSALRGLAASNPRLNVIPSEKVVHLHKTPGKVAVISGGGAGHEPLHAGFVGSNLLDAAVSGAIFASPSTRQIMAAVKATATKEDGAVIVVKNYTGDILHFGLVVERAKREGYNVELVKVSDDVAVGKTQNKMVGRRGLAGTALVHKIVGAAASAGLLLADVARLGRAVNDGLVTVSASLSRTSVPGRDDGGEPLGEPGVAELGLGIHNEPGQKINTLAITEVIDLMYKRLLDSADAERNYVAFNQEDDYVLLINNIGGTSSLELYAITQHALSRCPLKKQPARVLVSDFVTSLNSPGFSITLMNLNVVASSGPLGATEVLKHLDTETDAPGWKPKTYSPEVWAETRSEQKEVEQLLTHPTGRILVSASKLSTAIKEAMTNVVDKEPLITKYDTEVGDGDCGETLKSGADAITKALENGVISESQLSDPCTVLSIITEIVEDSMGGTSGGIYAIFLTSLTKHLQECSNTEISTVAQALQKALYDGLFHYTKARKGDRTLVDTLQPFIDALVQTGDLLQLLKEARKGCESTARLDAKFGRSSYVTDTAGIPDPGAVGLLAILEGFVDSYAA